MPTPAYTQLDRNAPDGGSGTGTTFSGSDLANDRALADAIVLLRSDGFIETRSAGTGTASQPQFIIFTKSTLVLRMNITWTGFNPTTVQYEWSNDSGSTFANVGSAQVNTFDGSQNITATTNSGGSNSWVMEIWAKVLKAVSDIAAHIAGTGTAVHGLGTASTQNTASFPATGTSTLDGTGGVGQTTPPPVDATRVREAFHDYGVIGSGGTVTLELDKYAAFAFTAPTSTANFTIAVSGAPVSGKFQTWNLEIINGQRTAGGVITYPGAAKDIGGTASFPADTALESSGRNIFAFYTRDGATRLEISHLGKGG